MITSVSWSGGIPSTGLVAAGIEGLLPRPDVVVFADTQSETESTYGTLEAWTPFIEAAGIRVLRCGAGSVAGDILSGGRFAAVPFYTRLPGRERESRLRRQCTLEYKVRPIKRALRAYLGLPVRGRLPVGLVTQWIGYTREEVGRLKPDRVAWIQSGYPWIELGWYRFNVVDFLQQFCKRQGVPMPSESACWMCPFRDDWHQLPEAEQSAAVAFDAAIRDYPRLGAEGPVYLHRSCRPLLEVIHKAKESGREPAPLQLSMALECGSGYCGL